jgi:hypothetical protein
MKTLLAITAVLCAASSLLHAADYAEAEFTRLFNEVKVLKENAAERDATVGLQIGAVTSVATGAESRAELRFPDKSLTRLGANSRFTLRGDKRTIDLDQGVMLLQVPKQMGGAKVRTAAVTAAVTGTTVMFEYLPGGFIKLIVIEGFVDLYFNKKPGQFTTVGKGQMIIMQVDSPTIPEPVDIDLKKLLKTSQLISAEDGGMPNSREVADALKEQAQELKKGNLVETNLVIPGRGTLVELSNNTRLDLFTNVGIKNGPGSGPRGNRGPNGNPGGPNGNPQVGPNPNGFQPLIAGTSVINENSEIRTNPHVTAFNSLAGGLVTSEGKRYYAIVPYSVFGFGENLPVASPKFQPMVVDNAPWAAFKFESLLINGTPFFNIPYYGGEGGEIGFANVEDFPPGEGEGEGPYEPTIRNLILSAVNDIRLEENNTFSEAGAGGESVDPYNNGLQLASSGVDNLVLYSQYGSIFVDESFGIYADFENVSLVAASNTSDVNIGATIDLGYYSGGDNESYYYYDEFTPGGKLLVSAGRDVNINQAIINANEVTVDAGRDININQTYVTSDKLASFKARGSITVDSSTTLKVLSEDPSAVLRLVSENGDVTINGNGIYSNIEGKNIEIESFKGNIALNGVVNTSSTDVFKVQTLGDKGWITIGNSTLNANQIMKLYAEGNKGGVRFVGNTTLNSPGVHINGKTVEILNGVNVNVSNAAGLNVYTDNPQFNTQTRDIGRGSFQSTGGTVEVIHKPFKDGTRPNY